MTDPISPTRLRTNLYRILDRVIDSGQPVEIERHGKRLRISVEAQGRMDLLKPHPDYLLAGPDELVHMDWFEEWRP